MASPVSRNWPPATTPIGCERRKPIAVAGYVATALGTAAFGLATNAWHVLLARAGAWLGRGIRTPVRKALLAGAVDRSAYARAFGLERAMDTVGAIIGPLSALFILEATQHNYRTLFAWTLVPGLLAAAVIAFLVQERERVPVKHISFGERLRLLPKQYRQVPRRRCALFGAGDFAHTMLILLATQKLTPSSAPRRPPASRCMLYVLHNVFYAGFSLVAGWLGDRFPKNLLLAGGYALAGVMTIRHYRSAGQHLDDGGRVHRRRHLHRDGRNAGGFPLRRARR